MIVLNDVLKGKHSVAIGGHIRPDGDCVGSTLGLYLYLTTFHQSGLRGRKTSWFFRAGVPKGKGNFMCGSPHQ